MDLETVKLLEIFPNEIWIRILESVNQLDHLTAWSHASHFFEDLLAEKRSQFVVSEVLVILSDNKFIGQGEIQNLLQLRLVSKCWKNGMNRFLESRSHHKNLKFDRYRYLQENCIAYPTYFRVYISSTWVQLESVILPKIGTTYYLNNNPFPTRHLEINERDFLQSNSKPEILNASRVVVDKFLEKAGHHFWYANIFVGFFIKTAEFHDLICKYVQHLPNLKSLNIVYTGMGASDIPRTFPDLPPFPKLKSLEFLSLCDVHKNSVRLITEANKQIKAFILDSSVYVALPYDDTIEPLEFNSLQNPDTICISPGTVQEFQRLPSEWDIRLFSLNIGMANLQLNNIFQKMEQCYKNTLVELYIDLPKATISRDQLSLWECSRAGRLDLPNLKTFHLETINYCSMDFLLGLVSLEHLSLYLYCDSREIRVPTGGITDEVIDFNNGHTHPRLFLVCNIWSLIPTMKTVDYQTRGGTELFKYQRGRMDYTVVQLDSELSSDSEDDSG